MQRRHADKIVYVGDAAGAKAFTGSETEVIDLAGEMVMPGFISAHDHLVASGWMNLGAQLYEGKSLDDYLRAIKEYADAHPDEEVIRGIGWNIENTGGRHPRVGNISGLFQEPSQYRPLRRPPHSYARWTFPYNTALCSMLSRRIPKRAAMCAFRALLRVSSSAQR